MAAELIAVASIMGVSESSGSAPEETGTTRHSNHLAPFLLTTLLDRLIASAPARIREATPSKHAGDAGAARRLCQVSAEQTGTSRPV